MIKKLFRNRKLVVFALALVTGVTAVKTLAGSTNNLRDNSVMITNRSGRHGGTGVVFLSTISESQVITNAHVCGVLEKGGGLVHAANGVYQVTGYRKSEVSDLCMVTVAANLGMNTEIAAEPPKDYELAAVSGHPALMPNVISRGHFSGRRIIPVMTGFKKCTDEDRQKPENILACAFFGGIPVVRNFESVLVSATIMPGSSGSGVYNHKNELVGLVFAGSQGFGYAWTVPYEQLLNFVNSEIRGIEKVVPDQLLRQGDSAGEEGAKSTESFDNLQKCREATEPAIRDICKLIESDAVWRKD